MYRGCKGILLFLFAGLVALGTFRRGECQEKESIFTPTPGPTEIAVTPTLAPVRIQSVISVRNGTNSAATLLDKSVSQAVDASENQPGLEEEVTGLPEEAATKSSVPVGDGDDEAEVTLFDLYLGDQYQGLILARFTQEWFQIEAPEDLVEQLPALKDARPILELVTGRIPLVRNIDGVGTVSTNLRNFKIVLKVVPENLVGKSIDLSGRISDPIEELSFRQDLRTTYSGTRGEGFDAAVTHRTLASYGKFYGVLNATYVDGQDYEVDRGSVSGIFGDYSASAGLLKTRGQQFAGSANFAGVDFRTAVELLANQETLRGSRLQIFVPSRAKVEFFRNGRLLSVQVLDFGLQEVDTSDFPQGSYDVDIVIEENSGFQTRSRRFFTKSGILAVRDRPIISFQLGALRNQLDTYSSPVVSTDVAWRVIDFLQVESAITSVDSTQIGSLGFLSLYRGFQLGFDYSLSSQGFEGISTQMNGTILDINFSSSYATTLGSREEPAVVNVDGNRPPAVSTPFVPPIFGTPNSTETAILEEQFNVISQQREDITAAVFKQFGNVELRYAVNRSDRAQIYGGPRRAQGPIVTWRVFETGSESLRLQLSALDTEKGANNTIFASYVIRDKPWTYGFQAINAKEQGEKKSRMLGTATYDNLNRAGLGSRLNVTSDLRDEDDQSLINTIDGKNVSRHLDAALIVQDQQVGDRRTSISVTADTSIVSGPETPLSISYPATGEAMVLAELKSKKSQAEMEVLVDGSPFGVLVPGTSMAIGLPPFRSYELKLRPKQGSELVGYTDEPVKITLFPGNMVHQVWNIEKTFIALGRLVNESGEPIVRKRIRGFNGYVATESDGTFQAEVAGDETVQIKDNDNPCTVKLPEIEEPQYFFDYGDLVCRSAAGQ